MNGTPVATRRTVHEYPTRDRAGRPARMFEVAWNDRDARRYVCVATLPAGCVDRYRLTDHTSGQRETVVLRFARRVDALAEAKRRIG